MVWLLTYLFLPSASCSLSQSSCVGRRGEDDRITINVPLFKKLRDIIFFGGENHFISHFEGHFEGAKTFFDARDNLGVKKVEAPSKCPPKWLIK